MARELVGRVAVLTGAGSGIGRACALQLAAEGCRLVLNDLNGDALAATADLLAAAGAAEPRQVIGDTGEPETAAALAAAAQEAFGRLDIWVNNAARSSWSAVADLTDADWQATLQVTLSGVFYGTRAALRAMTGEGSIINIASGAALRGEPGLGAYAAAKAGVVNLTQTAAVENAHRGLRCNAILPGPIATPPMLAAADASPGGRSGWESRLVARRFGRPEEIADAVCFLASDRARYINGVALPVDGAQSARTASPDFHA